MGNIEKNYEEMKRYYLMAFERGRTDAIFQLAYHYRRIGNYEEMKRHYLMAIERGNEDAMFQLAYHYRDIEKNYEEMEKYFLMVPGTKKYIKVFKF